MRILAASALYFGTIFALGAVLGVLRTSILSQAPDVTRLEGVLVELPLILAASWLASSQIMRRCAIRASPVPRVQVGLAAFWMMALAEFAIASLALGLTFEQHIRSYFDPSHALGLAGQLAFSLIPAVQLLKRV